MSNGVPPVSTLVAIRAAHHGEVSPAFDRVVFEFSGPVPQLNIGYVPQLLGDASGLPIPVAGNAIVRVSFTPARAHNEQGQPTAPNHKAFTLHASRRLWVRVISKGSSRMALGFPRSRRSVFSH